VVPDVQVWQLGSTLEHSTQLPDPNGSTTYPEMHMQLSEEIYLKREASQASQSLKAVQDVQPVIAELQRAQVPALS
jgi:hypothetical protein